ncbi:MAG: transposase [Bifidobacteriaceae bacterium]|jgi:transposase|nr:transposase [Bifidobacteriaceae bacterium]
MPLSARIKVPIPETGVIVSHDPKRPYVYKVLKTYRNAKGQPTNDRRSIGRLDAATGLLVPNDYYWQAYPGPAVETLPEPDAIRSIGASFLVARVLAALGVAGILEDAFGAERAGALLDVACYMARRGNVIEGIADWCETSTLKGTQTLTGQSASRLFASVTHAEKMAFFRAWAALQKGPAYLAYDVTSVSTYSEGVGDAEWGYNRDREAIPQVNLGCYLDQASGLPVFYVAYPGSITDKSHLPSMTAYNQDLGVKDVTFVLDRGFASTANVACLRGSRPRPHYILGVASRLKTARAAVERVRAGITEMGNRLPGGVYGQAVKGRFLDAPGTLHVYFSPALCEERRDELARKIGREAEQLARLDQLTEQEAKRHSAHFKVNLAGDGSFTSEPDAAKIAAAARDTGFFCLLTDTGLATAEVLEVYRRRDVIEKAFDDLKNCVDMKRLRTHRDETTDGKLFSAFIALIACSQIQAKAIPALKKSKQSVSKRGVLAEMHKIKVVDASSGRRLINPATKTQRQILEALSLTEADLKSYAAGGRPPTPHVYVT